MATCTIIIKDEVNIKIEGLELTERKALSNKFKYDIPGARYLPAVRLGRWDGKVAFFQLGGSTYTNLLVDIIPYLYERGYDIELKDLRTYNTQFEFSKVTEETFKHKVWPAKHPMAGKPVELRDYQIEIINKFLENPQCIQEIATGAGKCRTYDSKLSIYLNKDTDVNLNISIGEFVESIAEFKDIRLFDNQEVNISDLHCYVSTPSGKSQIDYIIKKENLSGLTIILENKIEIKCAKKHILQQSGRDVYASSLKIGDSIDTISGLVKIVDITTLMDTTFYDIGIEAPHIYYDSDGVVHHNTLITAALSYSCEPHGRTIVIVPNKSLVTQTEADYINLGLDVGVYFGDRKEYGRTHTICTWQSLNIMLKNTKNAESEVDIGDFIEDVVCIMVDEVHMAKADALKTLLTSVMSHIPMRWGLTGTVPKEAYEFVSLRCSIGEVIGRLSASELQDQGVLANCHVNVLQLVDHVEYADYQSELRYLLESEARLDAIARMIEAIRATGNTLVLVDRIAPGTALVEKIADSVFVSGGTKATARKDSYDEIAVTDNKVIVATYGVAAVGINIPRIFNLVLIEPGKSFVRVIQSIGRGIRKAEDKDYVEIWDITSTCKFAKRHLTKRRAFYNDANYPFSVKKIDWQALKQIDLTTLRK